jgi:xylulose-5-phosphate/fructose-6-phosphate phosphoketolase
MDHLNQTAQPLGGEELHKIDAWWRAANYLNVGQIYLSANPLLREPLKIEHIKPRLLGHWGTSPGLNLIYAHMNRLIKKFDLNTIYMAGPGHGGPALIANVYLERSYTEFYPDVTQDEAGLLRLFRQFSTPGGIPSHVSVPTPGSIHEGGELGYVLVHAFGAVMDNPDLLVVAAVGDGEAETGPLAGSWKSIDFINAARDGAVLPILHLNGYKIAGQQSLCVTATKTCRSFSRAKATSPVSSRVTCPRSSTSFSQVWPSARSLKSARYNHRRAMAAQVSDRVGQ